MSARFLVASPALASAGVGCVSVRARKERPMIVEKQDRQDMGTTVVDFDVAAATPDEFDSVKKLVYSEKIVVLKGQKLSPAEFVQLGRRLGRVERYYQPMYWHPEE